MQNREQIGPRIEYLKSFGEGGIALTPNYKMGLDTSMVGGAYTIRIRHKDLEHSGSHTQPNIAMVFGVLYSSDGNFQGLRLDEGGKLLSLWVETDPEKELLINYGRGRINHAVGHVIDVVERTGPKSYRRSTDIQKGEWQKRVTDLRLPMHINIPDTTHRLVFAQDLQTGFPLTDDDLVRNPVLKV